jgi:hypothetical protein|nr:MAG TPA: hypothetical protein [Caudoviricetes sp.]
MKEMCLKIIDIEDIEDMLDKIPTLLTVADKFNEIVKYAGTYNEMIRVDFKIMDEFNENKNIKGHIRLTYVGKNGEGKFYSLDEDDKCFHNNLLLAKYIFDKMLKLTDDYIYIMTPKKVCLTVYMVYLD